MVSGTLWASELIGHVELVRQCECGAVPSCNLCDGQGYVVLFEQASNTFYVTVDTVYAAAITAAIVPLLTMKVYFEGFPSTLSRYGIATPYSIHVSYPLLNGTSVCVIVCACVCVCHWLCIHVHVRVMSLCACDVILFPLLPPALDGFDAMSVQNVGSTYIIVSWDLPTDSNGILINFSLFCNGALAGVLPLTVINYNTTGLLPFTLYMHMYVFSATVCNMRK